MENILLNISNTLILSFFIIYLLIIILGKNKKVTNTNTFSILKDIISDNNNINIILNKSLITYYNIKRKVIKLSYNCYYSNKINYISLGLIEAGILKVDKTKNKWIELFRNIFSNMKIIYLFSIIALFISNSSYSKDTSITSIFIILICYLFNYIFICIKKDAYYWINDNIKNVNDIDKQNYAIAF